MAKRKKARKKAHPKKRKHAKKRAPKRKKKAKKLTARDRAYRADKRKLIKKHYG